MKKFFLFLLLCGWIGILQAHQQQALKRFLSTDGLQAASVGISMRSLADGKVVLNHCAETALTPASVLKLLPTWFALQSKGEEFCFQTTLGYTGEIKDSVLYGDLVIIAGGDPTLDSRYFPQRTFLKEVISTLQKQGILRIEGKIRVEGAIRGETIPGSWLWEDISNYYGALYLPFNYRDNLFTIRFQTGIPGSQAQLLSVVPELPGIEIRNQVKAGEENKKDAWIYGGPYSEVLVVQGSLPPHQSSVNVRGVLHDPASVFIAELKAQLQQNNIQVEEQFLEEGEVHDLLTFRSPSLSEIVYHTNKVSVNLFAEALGNVINEKEGVVAIKEQLEQMGIDVSGMILEDVCGLSLKNAVPAQLFTDLLVYIAPSPSGVFLHSLPEGGKDGGLNGYCVAAPKLRGRLRAKTGSMSGVRCLSGYLMRQNGSRIAFTILVNHYTCSVSQLQKAIGEFLTAFL